jgi:hypothetical protein
MDILFISAGLALMANVAISVWLFSATRQNPIAHELFARPNAWLGSRPASPQLLHFKFSLPWVAAPDAMVEQPFLVRGAFHVARIAGAAFPCLMVAFFIGAFIQ